MWNEITSQSDLDYLMKLFGGFHDSCIKEFKYVSGAFVNENLSMQPINSERALRIVFQRQFNNPLAIEMEFIGLLQLSLYPADENKTSEILDATMTLNNNSIYWYDCDKLSENDLGNYKGTVICSSRVRWRTSDEYIGQKEIYTGN